MSPQNDGSVTGTGSDASNDSIGASDFRNMNTDGAARPSSPAKRSAADLDDDTHDSARSKNSAHTSSDAPIASPLPNRTRPSPLGVNGSDANATSKQLPSIEDQVIDILPQLQDRDTQDGQMAYLAPMSWLKRLLSRTKDGLENHEFPKESREGDVGPVDTRGLVPSSAFSDLQDLRDGFGNHVVPIKTGLTPGEDYEFVPQKAWDSIMGWYGLADGAPVITRFVRDTSPEGDMPNYQYELYPPVVTVQKVVREQQRGLDNIGDSGKMAARVAVSRSEKYQLFLKRAKQAAGVDMQTKVKVWKILEPEPNAMPTPEPSRGSSPAPHASPALDSLKLVLGQAELNAMPEGVRREEWKSQDETANDKYNGSLSVAAIGFSQVQTIVLEEQVKTSLVDKARQVDGTQAGTSAKTSSSDSGQGPSKSVNASKVSSALSKVTNGRGRLRSRNKSRGSIGLTNLGNSCYMNSALQCLRSVQELTEYFLSQQYLGEINEQNPLGSKGHVAKAYGGLINTLYNSDSGFAPRNFKATISRHYPTFQGYGQQDSQEFVSSLLDGLHEDLNQILKKPYFENPDSDDNIVGNPEAIRALGELYRENFRKRNESVVIDLFNGWYKNTLVCPVCDKVSITFDPFSQVTLQLPIENTLQFTVTVYPLRDTPRKITLDIEKHASNKAVKEFCVERLPGMKAENLVMIEVYNDKVFKVFQEGDTFAEGLQSQDIINLYELDQAPTNWPPLDKKKSKRSGFLHFSTSENVPGMESPHADRMAVPVVTRLSKGARYQLGCLQPFFVLITREEAKDSDLVFRKVLAKLDTLTTRELCPGSEASVSSPDDGSGVYGNNIRKSDENKVEMHSNDGEDDFVDVSFTKEQKSTGSAESSFAPKPKSKILDTSYFIDADLRNIFDIGVYSGSDVIAHGFGSLSETTKYPRLDDRMPRLPHRRLSTDSRASSASARRAGWDANHSDVDVESEDDLAQSHHSLRAPSQPESEDDSDAQMGNAVAPTHNNHKPHHLRDRFRGIKNAVSRRSKSRGEEYILKLGEELVLDFHQDGYDQLFGGDSGSDFRGMRTDVNIPTAPDPELEKKRERRAARKKAGVNLDECFDESAKSEVLSEDNAWYCNRCKERRRATKTLELWSIPDILVVHLKRFGSGGRFGRDKVDILVDFPTTGLNMNSRVGITEGRDLTYDLFAVDNHAGGLGGGHYTADARNFLDKEWYDYNDSFVSRTSAQSAVSRQAYLLFYRRRSDKPLGSPRLQELLAKNATDSSNESDSERDDNEVSTGNDSMSDTIPSRQPSKTGATKGMLGGSAGFVQPPVDEGLGLDEDEIDNPLPSIEAIPSASRPSYRQSWSFGHLGEGAAAPSNSVNGANEDSDTLQGDGNASDQAGHGSDTDERMRDLLDDEYPDGGQIAHLPPEYTNAEETVHDIHLSDNDEQRTSGG